MRPERPSTKLRRFLDPQDVGVLDSSVPAVTGMNDAASDLMESLELSDDDEMATSGGGGLGKRQRPAATTPCSQDAENGGGGDDEKGQPGRPSKRLRLAAHKTHEKDSAVEAAGRRVVLGSLAFDEAEFSEEEAPWPAPKRQHAVGYQQEQGREEAPPEKEQERAPHAVVELKRIMHEGVPLVSNTMHDVRCRCVYASLDRGAPGFNILEKNLALPYDFSRQPWAVMARYGGGGGKKEATEPERALSREDERGAKPPAAIDLDPEWFVLVAATRDADLCCVASPFFTYHLSVAQIDPEAALFRANTTAPVMQLRAVLDKTPLFSGGNEAWEGPEIVRAMSDTLYAHALLPSTARGVGEVLAATDAFEMAEAPHKKLLPPAKVSLNRFSERKERAKALREAIQKPSRERFKGLDPVRGSRTSALLDCKSLRGYQTALFTDLEKPRTAFRLLAAGVPAHVLSALSSWREVDRARIQRVFNTALDAFTYRKRDGRKFFPVHVATQMRLSPEWFAQYYEWLRDQRRDTSLFEKRASRLASYRTFVTSDLYHDIVESIRSGRSHVVFLMTRRHRARYFESNFFAHSKLDADEALLCEATAAAAAAPRGRVEPLTEEEEGRIEDMSLEILAEVGRKEFAIVRSGPGSTGARIAASKLYLKTLQQLGDVVVRVCDTWARAVQQQQQQQHGALPRAYREMAPVVAKASYVYAGARRRAALDAIVTALENQAGERVRVQVICPGEPRAKMGGKVQSASGSKYTALVLDALHLWRLEQLKALCDFVMRRKKGDGHISHLVALSHANTLSRTAGAQVAWDLIDIAFSIESLSLPDVGPPALLDVPSAPARWVPPGERSLSLFPLASRQEQLDYNRDFLEFSQERPRSEDRRDFRAVLSVLRQTPGNASPSSVLVAHARNQTRQRISGWVHNNKRQLVQGPNPIVVFVSYYELQERLSALQNVRVAILADVRYDGPNRPTCLHINSILELARERTVVLSRRSAFETAYKCSDEKSDRHTYHLGRTALLKQRVDERLYNADVCQLAALTRDASGGARAS